MRRDILEIDASWNENTWEPELTLADVESIRLLLGGGSVVDWQRLAMSVVFARSLPSQHSSPLKSSRNNNPAIISRV